MSFQLPKLPDLPDLPEIEEEVKSVPKRENIPKRTTSEQKSSKSEPKAKPKKKSKRPKMPKSQYDADGNPILTVPDIDHINLNDEIDRYFGKGDYDEEG